VAGDIFVNIQGDEPLIAPEMIDQGIQLLLDDPSASVGTLIKQISSQEELLNPNIVKVVFDHKGYAIYFSRSIIPFVRGEADKRKWLGLHTFYKHIGMYIYRRTFLLQYTQLPVSHLEKAEKLEQLRILEAGYKIKAGRTTYDSIPIDTPEDVARVIAILRQTSSGT
jgi:3-deoxy-manno-octulosonate cytidylyltransferase (CMP-KDO synthetase)